MLTNLCILEVLKDLLKYSCQELGLPSLEGGMLGR